MTLEISSSSYQGSTTWAYEDKGERESDEEEEKEGKERDKRSFLKATPTIPRYPSFVINSIRI